MRSGEDEVNRGKTFSRILGRGNVFRNIHCKKGFQRRLFPRAIGEIGRVADSLKCALNVFRSKAPIFVWFSPCIGSPFESWVSLGRNTILKPSAARGEARVGANEASEARRASKDSGLTSTERVEKWGRPVAQVWSRSIRSSRRIQSFLSQFPEIWGNPQQPGKLTSKTKVKSDHSIKISWDWEAWELTDRDVIIESGVDKRPFVAIPRSGCVTFLAYLPGGFLFVFDLRLFQLLNLCSLNWFVLKACDLMLIKTIELFSVYWKCDRPLQKFND
jgi:hypothetical protein